VGGPSCGPGPHYRGFTVVLRHTTLGRAPLDERLARRRDIYLTTQHSQETDIHAAGGIRTRNPSKRAAADHALDRAVAGIGNSVFICK